MMAQPSAAPIPPLKQAPSSSSSSVTSADFTAFPPPAEVVNPVAVKEEEEDYVGDDEIVLSFDGLGCKTPSYCSASSVNLPKPMEGLSEIGPPPFLKKTFEMVEDPATNETVSWSENGDSFIVWDAFDFSKNLLPKYFKHSNFSSFIRQLNTYGFRKIDPDKWEFANEGFRGGKKHLLKNIKRRNRHNKQQQGQGNSHGDEPEKLVLESQIESLKNDQDQLRLEILKLGHQQEESKTRISTIENRIQSANNKQLQMLIFLAKTTKSRSFLGNFLGKMKQRKELNCGFSRKRRLIESSPDESVECRNQARQQLATMQTQLAAILGEESEPGKSMPKLFETPLMCDVDNQESVYHMMTEKLLDDGEVNWNSGDDNLDVNDSKFYLELEDLIGKPRAWGGFATELAGCI